MSERYACNKCGYVGELAEHPFDEIDRLRASSQKSEDREIDQLIGALQELVAKERTGPLRTPTLTGTILNAAIETIDRLRASSQKSEERCVCGLAEMHPLTMRCGPPIRARG